MNFTAKSVVKITHDAIKDYVERGIASASDGRKAHGWEIKWQNAFEVATGSRLEACRMIYNLKTQLRARA